MADYNLDIKKSGCQFQAEGLRVGDCGLREFKFHFCEGSSTFTIPSDCTATLYAVLPDSDGTTVYSDCDISENTVIYTLVGSGGESPALTSFPGLVQCEIRLTASDGQVLTSPRFTVLVDGILQNDEAIEAQSDFSALTDALCRVLEAESGLSSKVDCVAGNEGNTVVFGPDGTIADSGIAPASSYTVTCDGSRDYDDQNRLVCAAILADISAERPFNAFIFDGLARTPAKVDASSVGFLKLGALFSNTELEMIYNSSNSNIIYKDNDTYSTDFSETKDIPATQQATAEWVKAYIEENIVNGAW